PATLSRLAHSPPCPDQGGQSWPWPGCAWPTPAHRECARSIQADPDLGFGADLRRFDSTAHWTRAEERPQVSVLTFIDIGLSILVVTVAASTIVMRELFAAVVSYVAYGLLLAFVWIRLHAPDVALTEAAVGGGVTGVLLITAGKRLVPLRRTATEAEPTLILKVL